MPATKTEINPFIRRSYGQRAVDLGKHALTLPRQGIQGFRRWPKHLRYLILFFGVIAAIGAAVAIYVRISRNAQEQSIKSERAAIAHELSTTSDPKKIIESCDRILALRPEDAAARSMKTALETLHADPNDSGLMMLVFRELLKSNRIDDLKIECERRLAVEPHDFYAHYLVMRIFVERKDLASAEPHLAALARPDVNNVNLNFSAIAGAMQYLASFQRDTTLLRQFTSEHIVPMMKSDRTANSEPEVQVMMLYLFCDTFRLPKIPQDAGLAWPAANRIADLCLEGAKEKGDMPSAGKLAMLGPDFVDILSRMKNVNQISERQRIDMSKECEERTRKAWEYVLEKDPKNAQAYLGISLSFYRSGASREFIETLLHGLEVCGDDPQLLQVFTNVSLLNYRGMEAYERLKAAAQRNEKYPKYWFLAAQAAFKADRRDLAFDALAKARKALPDDLDVIIMQADLSSGTGYPEKVLASLAVIGDEKIIRMPNACRLFTRALGEIGDDERLNYCLQRALELSRKTNDAKAAFFAALGLYEAEPSNSQRDARLAEYLVPLTERWRIEFPAGMTLRAAALVRACETKPGPLDPIAARDAIVACESALAVDPNHVPTCSNLVRLRLRGDRDAAKALSEIGPLLAHCNALSPDQLESLAMAYTANKLYDDAIRVVMPYTTGRTSAGCWVQLAIAYHGQGRADEANKALDRANEVPMSDRERADYSSTRDLLSRVKP